MSHPARFDLDSLFIGNIAGSEAIRLRQHVAACAACGAYLRTLEEERTAQIASLDPNHFAARVAVRAAEPKQRRWRWALAVAGAAAVAALLAIVLQNPEVAPPPAQWMGPDVTTQVYVLRGGETQAIGTAPVGVGDRLRIEVILPPGRVAYAALFGREGEAVFPVIPQGGVSIEVRERLLLPGSADLQPGGGRVSLLLIVRRVPFELAETAASIRTALDAEEVPDGLVQRWDVDLGLAP